MRLPGVGALSAKWPWMRYALRDLVQDDNTARLNMAYVVSNPPATFTPRTSTPVSANQRTPRAGVWPARRSWKSAAVRACRGESDPAIKHHLAGIDVSHRAIGAPSTPWKVGVRPHVRSAGAPAGALPRRTNPPLLSRRQQSWAATRRLEPSHKQASEARWRSLACRHRTHHRCAVAGDARTTTPPATTPHSTAPTTPPPRRSEPRIYPATHASLPRLTRGRHSQPGGSDKPPTRSQPCGPRRLAEQPQRSG